MEQRGNHINKQNSSIEKDAENSFYVPEGSLILGEGQYYSKDSIQTHLNNNICVIGTSGSGKTRGYVSPNILQADGSYVVSDPKGNLADKFGPYLESLGYRIICMDFIHPEKSLRYNPIMRCGSTQDVMRLAYMIVYELCNDKQRISTGDDFWDKATLILMMALIAYMMEATYLPANEKTFSKLAELIADAYKETGSGRSEEKTKRLLDAHRRWMENQGKESWAYKRYNEFSCAPEKTHNTINMTSLAKLALFDTLEVRVMLSGNDLDFKSIGQEPTAVFVQVSDTDRSMDAIVNMFYSQVMNELCDYADTQCVNSRLPIPVQFILDDFATNARINNFENIISNIRSRGISTMIILQSEAQLRAAYGDSAQTIVDNCNTYVYLGGSSPEQAERIAKRADKPASQILNMPLDKAWIFRRGQMPILCDVFDLNRFEDELGFEYGKPAKNSSKEYDAVL